VASCKGPVTKEVLLVFRTLKKGGKHQLSRKKGAKLGKNNFFASIRKKQQQSGKDRQQ